LKAKGKPVLVSLNASAAADGREPEAMSLLTSGEFWEKKDGYLLRYQEQLDDSSPTMVEFCLQSDAVTMRRSGDYEADMIFRKGQRYEGQYNTPFGALGLGLFCTQIKCAVDSQGGELHLQYQLDINRQFVAVHEMELSFSVKGN
jgi:uncharacterized beta-barrel protein YwiB (DUF1934 family)